MTSRDVAWQRADFRQRRQNGGNYSSLRPSVGTDAHREGDFLVSGVLSLSYELRNWGTKSQNNTKKGLKRMISCSNKKPVHEHFPTCLVATVIELGWCRNWIEYWVDFLTKTENETSDSCLGHIYATGLSAGHQWRPSCFCKATLLSVTFQSIS